MRAAVTVIPAIAALPGDHPSGDKRDGEEGEEDLERPERGLGRPGGQEGDAGATAHDPPHHGLDLERAVRLPLVDLLADHRGRVTVSSAPHVIHDRPGGDDWPEMKQAPPSVGSHSDGGEDGTEDQHHQRRAQPRRNGSHHVAASSSSGSNILSTVRSKNRAIRNASGSDGRYRPFSIEITVCRDTPRAAASSACDRPRWVRCSRTRFLIMSRYLNMSGCQACFTQRAAKPEVSRVRS